MKQIHFHFVRTLLCCSALAVAAGCSSETETASATDTTEIKGAPIVALEPEETNAPVAQAATTQAEPASTPAEKEPPEPAASETNQLATSKTPRAPAKEMADATESDYLEVGFDHLAGYEFEISDALLEGKGEPEELAKQSDSQIPEAVRKLDQTRVAVRGYMLPLKVEDGAVTEFLLMRDQSMCCYGTVPKINEWVSVKTVDKGVKPVMDEPIVIYGRLHVGEIRENGYLVGLYRMDGDGMDDSPEPSSKM